MATVIGGSPAGGIPVYRSKPTLNVFMQTPNPDGYVSQQGEYGTRPGTIIPHVDTERSFDQLQKPKHNIPISVIAIRDATPDNPFGGVEVLVPPMLSDSITPEMRNSAMERAKQMTNDPMQQGLAMFQILAEATKAGSVSPPAPVAPVAPPPAAAPVPAPVAPAVSPNTPVTLEMLAQLLGLRQAVQQPLPPPATPAFQPPATPAFQPPATPAFQPPPLPPAPPQAVSIPQFSQAGPAVPPPAANPLACLSVPDLGLVAVKPQARVNFNLGPLGQQSAYYHWVVQEKNALYLVFDTRYDYPMWTPPDLGAEQQLAVTLDNVQNGPLTVNCFSCGHSFRFGVFQFTMLILAAE